MVTVTQVRDDRSEDEGKRERRGREGERGRKRAVLMLRLNRRMLRWQTGGGEGKRKRKKKEEQGRRKSQFFFLSENGPEFRTWERDT